MKKYKSVTSHSTLKTWWHVALLSLMKYHVYFDWKFSPKPPKKKGNMKVQHFSAQETCCTLELGELGKDC